MMKKIISIIVLIGVIISFVLFFNWLMTSPEKVINEGSDGETSEEIISEIDTGLLGEDDEIEIGEMI